MQKVSKHSQEKLCLYFEPQIQFFTARTRVPKTAHGFSKPKEASRREKGRFEALYANSWPWIQNAI